MSDNGKKFMSEAELEHAILFLRGKELVLECDFRIHVPRWSVAKASKLGDAIAGIIAALFPDKLFFLASLDWSTLTSDTEKFALVHDVLFRQVFDKLQEICRITLGAEVYEQLEDILTPLDFVNILSTIVEQEIQNPAFVALLKKTSDLIQARLQLEISSIPSPVGMDGR